MPPTKGCWDRTAGQLIEELRHYHNIHAVVGDCSPEAGAWICFNPVDGNGRSNDNVTDYRYALVECDNMELEKQQAIIRQLELPCAALVYSGGKSLHAIVRVGAPDYAEYRKRVDYLYTVCQKNGLTLDQQNRNPSRLSRMPGIVRGERSSICWQQTWAKPAGRSGAIGWKRKRMNCPMMRTLARNAKIRPHWQMHSSKVFSAEGTRCC